MKKHVLVVAAALAGCAGVPYQTIQVTNRTTRAIPEIYVYPIGAADHGTSLRSLAPSETAQLKVRGGKVEVLAVSAKLEIDEHTRDQPSASQDLELTGPVTIIFYDLASKPAEVNQRGVVGIAFQLAKSNAPPPPPSDAN